MKIGQKRIRAGKRCYIIAEIGSNWESLEDCYLSIDSAKLVGADAVKFQLFTSRSLYGFELKDWPGKKYELPFMWLHRLKDYCVNLDIEFLCSTFSPEDLVKTDCYVEAHKIASSDSRYTQLLEAAKRSRKPILLSTGGDTLADIIESMRSLYKTKVIPMYCVPSYPASSVDLTKLRELRSISRLIGYSDHSRDAITIPSTAAHRYKVHVIEKHFNPLQRNTPDTPHSLSESEFQRMVLRIRNPRHEFSHDPQDYDMHFMYKRRLVATKTINIGETFQYGTNYGCYRVRTPTIHGLPPSYAKMVHGRNSKTSLSQGLPITYEDVD